MTELTKPTEQTTPRKLAEICGKVVEHLEPLTAGGRARVLLMLILQLTPDAFSDEQLIELMRDARQP